MLKNTEQPGMLTVNDVADYLQISVSKVWRLIKTHGFPKPFSLGRRNRRWRQSDIDAYVETLK